MRVPVPEHVRRKPRGVMVAETIDSAVVLFVREDLFELKRYPAQKCAVDLRLATWDMSPVLLTALILRLARNDATTFDLQLDVSTPPAVRLLQSLVDQAQIDIHLVTDVVVRSFRIANPVRLDAGYLVNRLRTMPAWPPEAHQEALARLNKLYPTAAALWRATTTTETGR